MMKKFFLSVLALFAGLGLTAADVILVGDSTMCYYKKQRAPLKGWGMYLQALCKPDTKVINLAQSGATIANYTRSRRWDKARTQMKKGDFVVIGMAINDKNSKDHDAFEKFQNDLKRWIADVREKEAIPVLTTSTVVWSKSGLKKNDGSLRKYNEAILAVAKETGTAAVDLNDAMFRKYQKMKPAEIKALYMAASKNPKQKDKDFCHFQAKGAELNAKEFVTLCKKSKLPVAACFK